MTYPVDTNDGLLEAVNYLLSGPTSLGQNFEGMSATGAAVLNGLGDVIVPGGKVLVTGTNNLPFTVPYSSPDGPGFNATYTIANIVTGTNPATIDVTVNLPPDILFTAGQTVSLSGVTPSAYDGTYKVVSFAPIAGPFCSVILDSNPGVAYTSGGTLVIANQDTGPWTTDCNAQVSVSGPTDRVFLSSYINAAATEYTGDTYGGLAQLFLTRYKAYVKDSPPPKYPPYGTSTPTYGKTQLFPDDPKYSWYFDAALLGNDFGASVTAPGFYTIPIDKIFVNVIDSPGIGLYWYLLEINYLPSPLSTPGTQQLIKIALEERSFTAQVIKR